MKRNDVMRLAAVGPAIILVMLLTGVACATSETVGMRLARQVTHPHLKNLLRTNLYRIDNVDGFSLQHRSTFGFPTVLGMRHDALESLLIDALRLIDGHAVMKGATVDTAESHILKVSAESAEQGGRIVTASIHIRAPDIEITGPFRGVLKGTDEVDRIIIRALPGTSEMAPVSITHVMDRPIVSAMETFFLMPQTGHSGQFTRITPRNSGWRESLYVY